MVKSTLILLLVLSIPQRVSAVAQESNVDLDQLAMGATVVSLADTKDVFKNADIRLPTKSGMLLANVSAYGPAYNAGLKAGCV